MALLKNLSQNMKSTELYTRAIQWAKKNGFSNIRANTDEFETPGGFTRKDQDTAYIPDISGVRLGGKSYIEIAMKMEDNADQVSKFKLLSTMAAMKSGKLYLLAPKGHKAYVDKTVKKFNISAEVVGI